MFRPFFTATRRDSRISRMVSLAIAILFLAVSPSIDQSAQSSCQETGTEAQEAPELIQVWNGTLKVGERELRFRFRVLQDSDDEISVELDSLDEGLNGIAGEFSQEGNEVTVEFSAVRATFVGTLNDDSTSIDGQWKQGGGSFDLDLTKAETTEIAEPNVVETFAGTLDAGLQKLRMQFRVVEDDDGEKSVLLDVLTQGAMGIPGSYERDGDSVVFDFFAMRAKYTGTINDEGTEIEGQWEQGGAELPYNLERIDAPENEEDIKPKRPQTPEEPFPYETRDVEIDNEEAGVKLSGTLSLPKEPGKYPVAILVSGSGPQDRDESLLGHKPFLVLSDALVRQGIAVLRYDDRGVGGSTGDFATATSKDFASDASACVDFLKTLDEINPDAIGIIGHSEGGLVGPMVATSRDDLGYIVMLAGPGVTGEEIIYAQTRLIAEAEGETEEGLDVSEKFLRAIVARIKESDAEEDLTDDFESMLGEFLEEFSENEEEAELLKARAIANLSQFQSPWFRYFLFHDPAPVLQEVDCPVLSIIGEKDLQVPYAQNIPAITEALKSGGNPDYKVLMLPGLNHLFQNCETGSPLEYQSIEETFDPETLTMIGDWILERFGE